MARLFIPGPTDVHPDVLAAQLRPMIGHRGAEFRALFSGLQPKLQQVFGTRRPVFVSTSSGTGLQEAAIRNCVAGRVLCCVNGAFAERWHQIALANGKEASALEVGWGQAIPVAALEHPLAQGGFEAVTVVHNETSTGAVSPIHEIAQLIRRRHPEVLLLVDAVSSLGGVAIPFDAWDLDVLLTSSQKCLAAPPGLALMAVSERAQAKAAAVRNRGTYFDFLEFEKNARKDQTPNTPAISLFYALDAALDRLLAEGLEARYERHARMAGRVREWAEKHAGLFAQVGHRSQTLTCVENESGLEVDRLNAYLTARGMQISEGYGKLRGKTFRIAHMGELTLADIEELLSTIDEFLQKGGTRCTGS